MTSSSRSVKASADGLFISTPSLLESPLFA
jgi:hypothetical protein